MAGLEPARREAGDRNMRTWKRWESWAVRKNETENNYKIINENCGQIVVNNKTEKKRYFQQ